MNLSNRRNDALFALTLGAAAISAGLITVDVMRGAAAASQVAAPAIQLERVVITAQRQSVHDARATTVILPRVLVTGTRAHGPAAVAAREAGALDS